MKRLYVLLVALAGLLGGAGYLYDKGYWDTWQDKKGELSALLEKDFVNQGAPADLAKKVADCSAEKLTEVLGQTDCEVPFDTPVDQAITACVQKRPEVAMLGGMAILICVQEAQADAQTP
jgi:hypothetical protein